MSGYAKLFSDIVDSSIWREPSDICKVWITLLALSDQNGYVRGSVGWLAGKAKVSFDACALAVNKFQAPDPESRTPDNDGRRIEALPDGWLILNYLTFRDRLSNTAIASATRERVHRHRERHEALRNAGNVTVAHSVYASASASEFVRQEGLKGNPGFMPAWRDWVAYRLGKAKAKEPEKMFARQLEMLDEWGAEGAIASMKASMANGWQGLFPPKVGVRAFQTRDTREEVAAAGDIDRIRAERKAKQEGGKTDG